MTRFFFVWPLRVSWCGAPSLTRGWVCNLLVQLLLGLATAVTLGSKSHRTNGHILLSHLRLSQLVRSSPRIYIPPEQGGPVIPLGTGFPFVASYNSLGYGGGILNRLHTKLGWLIGLVKHVILADSLYFLYLLLLSIPQILALSQLNLGPSSYACWAHFNCPRPSSRLCLYSGSCTARIMLVSPMHLLPYSQGMLHTRCTIC
jgi:hypothetical protein